MTPDDPIDTLKSTILAGLPLKVQGEITAAIEQGEDWDDQGKENLLPPIRQIEFFQPLGEQPEEVETDPSWSDKTKYPQGYWLHGYYVFPVIQVWDGIIHVGYVQSYDHGETVLGCFYDIAELNDVFLTLDRYRNITESSLVQQTQTGKSRYLEWGKAFGRNLP